MGKLDPQIALAAAGDMAAFEELYRDHHRRVYSICLRMTRNASDAEDLTQDVFDLQIALAAAGDMAAFEELYRDHHRRVYSICLRMTRNASDAEDLTQDVFVQ